MFTIDNSVNSQSASKNLLPGNTIHTVTFVGAEAADLKDGQFKTIQLKFENEQGEFVDTIFEPGSDDYTRKANSFGGENPSGVEELLAKVRHAIAAVNPELDKKIESGEKPLTAPSWDGLRKLVVAALDKGVGKTTQIKLINDTKGRARFPGYVLGISKNNNLYMRTNYIGDNLQFTPKEIERINNQANAKITNMSAQTADGDISLPEDTVTTTDFDFDINSL